MRMHVYMHVGVIYVHVGVIYVYMYKTYNIHTLSKNAYITCTPTCAHISIHIKASLHGCDMQINQNFQRFLMAYLYQFTTGTPLERFPFICELQCLYNILYIHIYIYIYTCTYVHIYLYMYIYICTHTHIHIHIHIYVYNVHTLICSCITRILILFFHDDCLWCTYMHACIHTCKHTCMHTFSFMMIAFDIRTCTHTYIHTYIHACIHFLSWWLPLTYVHARIHTYMHAYIFLHNDCLWRTCVCVHVHVYVYMYMCMYTWSLPLTGPRKICGLFPSAAFTYTNQSYGR
jgi:hypothetical protein